MNKHWWLGARTDFVPQVSMVHNQTLRELRERCPRAAPLIHLFVAYDEMSAHTVLVRVWATKYNLVLTDIKHPMRSLKDLEHIMEIVCRDVFALEAEEDLRDE